MSFLRDVRLSSRTLAKNPGFTAVAVAMLALGIGVNATVFTVTNAVLFKGFRLVSRNDRLAYISNDGCCVSYPDFEDYRAQAKSFAGMAIVHGVSEALADKSGFPERYEATEVSADTFRLVGQRPILGRDFTPSDETPGASPVAMLNYGFWERRYGKDPAIIGSTVRMNGAPTTVIGVMAQGFDFPQKVDLWVPLVPTPEVRKRENRDTWFVLGRLAEGVTMQTARAEIETISRRLASAYPLTNRDLRPVVQRFHEFMIGPNATVLYGSMWGAVGFVLLIACANLANLLLARAIGRSREVSVRIALGAGKWRIIRQLLIESVMLSGLGGIFGWWIAKWGVRAYQLAMAQKESWLILDYAMDYRVLAYLIAISMGTGLLFGLAPALRLSNLDINTALKNGSRGATGGGRGKHLSSLLVAGEMALAVVLLAGAGVMIRSFLKIHNADIGANIANILVTVPYGGLPPARYPSAESRISFYDRLRERAAAMPGVESVALASQLPSWGARRFPYELAGAPVDEKQRPRLVGLSIGPAYFRMLGAAVLSGRDFNDADGSSAPPVAIVNQRLATRFWPGEDPLGKRLRLFDGSTPGPWLTVVGVASNIIQNDINRQQFDPVIYLPYRQKPEAFMWVLARTGVRPASLASTFRRETQSIDSALPMYGPFTLAERLEVFWDSRFYGILFLIFAAIALLLASIGLYAVIAHSVNQRTQEIGIRIAVGATARDILKLVLQQGMLPLVIGLTIGLAASLAVNRLLKSLLVQVSPADPITLAVASAILLLSATLGCLIPAMRAVRVDPALALRNE
ncbi:MAG TPA: ABC transporter permease [Bryobacteraceae bacterium]|nr:ABC transporter permease [Bryobacteraceae bacterium]